jgi:MEDS: MEthanogen/methylotroph, DcmR Sensory domain
MQFGEHNMLVYSDLNSLREIYSSHTQRSLQLRNNAVIILYHYETKISVVHALKELDIAVEHHEADRSLIILDANEVIFKPTFNSFLQYLKTLGTLAIKSGRNGIDVVIDMGAFRHRGKEQELLEYERTFNITSRGSKSSILCCYHKKDVEVLDATRKEEIHKSHLKNYIVKEQE